MKIKGFLAFAAVVFTLAIKAQITVSCCYNGYWGEYTGKYSGWQAYGNNSGFAVYSGTDHPSNYFFRFSINNYRTPSKEELKLHNKTNTWYEYSGTVEYYVCEKYPTIVDILKEYGYPCFKESDSYLYAPIAKRTALATIKIAPYKKYPRDYNFWFDGVGIAISLGNWYFNQ